MEILSTTKTSSTMSDTLSKKKRSILNKFLSKTYHMIDTCDTDIASWSNAGTSFTIKDVQRFQEEYLPKYFNHSKFSSFVRQLNFYNFQKLRNDPDLQIHTESVRFAHEYFRRGQPELLNMIQRSTAQKPNNSELEDYHHVVENLQQKIDTLQQRVNYLESSIEQKVEQAVHVATHGYMTNIRKLELSYDRLLNGILQHLATGPPPSLATSNVAIPSRPSWVSTTTSPTLTPMETNLIKSYIRANSPQG